MAYTPSINTHGKPYGAYPYGVANPAGFTSNSLAALQHQQASLIASSGLIGQLASTGIGGGLLGQSVSTISSVASLGTIPANGSVSISFSSPSITRAITPMPFTKKIVDILRASEPRMPKKRVPDYIEPITAWRAWCIYNDKLHAIGTDIYWEPKRPMEAVCVHHEGEHDAPVSDCTCGIWSFKELDGLLEAIKSYNTIKVIGKVSLWGKVIETENGYRAQFAYPKELWLSDASDEEIGLTYNVPIRTISLDKSVNSEVK